MFDCVKQVLSRGIEKYHVTVDGELPTYDEALNLLSTNPEFRTFLNQQLAESAFSAFRWETPAISRRTMDREFEFVLLDSPGFVGRVSDAKTFSSYFTDDETDGGIVVFANVGGDATLIVPSPRTSSSAYGHFAAFVRNAPSHQIDALWRLIGETMVRNLGQKPIWLSTAGGGVAWLHVRLDSSPKYYAFHAYRAES